MEQIISDSKNDGPFSPMSLDEYANTIDESRQQIKNGKLTRVEDLEKESEHW